MKLKISIVGVDKITGVLPKIEQKEEAKDRTEGRKDFKKQDDVIRERKYANLGS